jgi:hypothetical protein
VDASGRPDPAAFLDGFEAALLLGSALALLGAIVAAATVRRYRKVDAAELAEAAA